MRSKTYTSKINLQRGKLTVENRKSRQKKRICSEVSVNSPGNPWSQSRRRNGSDDLITSLRPSLIIWRNYTIQARAKWLKVRGD